MDRPEFEKNVKYIDSMNASAKERLQSIKSELISINNMYKRIERNKIARDKAISAYLNDLKDLSFDGDYTDTSVLFPGIHTISQEVDPNELKDKGARMKDCASTYELSNSELEADMNGITNALKRMLSDCAEFNVQESNIDTSHRKLLFDCKSIYNIAGIDNV